MIKCYNLRRFFSIFDRSAFLDSFAKLGVNFTTAGVVGVFLTNHFDFHAGFQSYLLVLLGLTILIIGAIKREKL
jgi:hypothetical protein